MQIQVLINPLADNRFQACGGSPFPLIAEGETPYEAVRNLRQLIQDRLRAGATVCRIDVPAHESRTAQWVGSWKPDDPLYEEWREAVEEYRRQVDEEPNNPEQDNPWLKMAGMWDRDDPLVQEWKEIMRENRLKDEEDADNP
jgi:hypothetical protein